VRERERERKRQREEGRCMGSKRLRRVIGRRRDEKEE
jgi:hypothetical protein